MASLISYIGVIRIKEHNDHFKFLIGEIIGQMLSNYVRHKLFEKLNILCDGNLTASNICRLGIANIRTLGISKMKCTYILNLSKAVIEKRLDFNKIKLLPDDEVLDSLMSIKGIGIWTAKMYLLFALQRMNILPIEDSAFIKGFNWLYDKKDTDYEYIKTKAKRWNPYCSIAARYLYECVNKGLTKYSRNIIFNE